MRIKLLFSVFFITLGGFAQDVAKDFDAPDSLYREDQFYLNITYNTLQKRPDGLKQNKLSPGLALGFLRDMPLNKKRTVALAAGLGYSLAIYNQNLGIIAAGNETTYSILDTENIAFSKNKLALHYVEVPIEFRWRNSTPDSHKFWRVHLGVKLGYLFYDQYKLESSQGNSSHTNLADLNDLHYGVYLTTGWNTWNLYAYYGLNSLFKSSAKIDGQSIDMNTANFGIMFYIL
ncbi:porin family protein [Flavobacterium rivulicola]|uniref:porin family protein n=1 Tax=Flavobacterium rivulicola TaxID=2732161 RepID=UPI00197F58DD|nr:porin family protein [Flavobacterium sp. IMCC34852]